MIMINKWHQKHLLQFLVHIEQGNKQPLSIKQQVCNIRNQQEENFEKTAAKIDVSDRLKLAIYC